MSLESSGKKSHKRLIALLSVTTALSLTLALAASIGYLHERRKTVAVGASVAANPTEPEPVAVDHNYELAGNKILLSDSTYGQTYLPVLAGVPAFSRQKEQLLTRNGRKYYVENGAITSKLGIDVSAHQKDIDWAQVKAAGIDFAIIRIGYRTYGGGEINADENFRKNVEGAKAAGVEVGAYFFSQAISEEEAVEEAQFVRQQLAGISLSYPVVYDWELIYDDTARTDDVPVDTLTDACLAFCQNVAADGYRPMIYQNKRTSLFKLDLARLTGIEFWLAEYSDTPTYYYDFNMWQYSCTGSVPGITGDVDMNLSFVDYAAAPAQ